ncbi:dynamin family protein [Aliarcobacter thereius]|nr:dynamin family protein [Aliarcobacter thereius]OCL93888.1 Bacterial dynamin-like protein [Aliarcobacter thereius]OCL95290.1 GTPase Era [Aliarcobacter thereius LMG 24486]QBF16721.1 GTP-binding protein (dynamin domain) [Aliarcobacter thereius LMG 24486]TLS94247.1 ATP-binding protein [Aliarcobacter thereius]TLT08604.1 ATP-binding protein [Aliarcobacter thereius]
MSLISDYFLLYHGLVFEEEQELNYIDDKLGKDSFTVFALILCAHRKNYTKFINLDSFKGLCRQLDIKSPTNINELNQVQYSIIDIISKNSTKESLDNLHNTFLYLKDENIISNENYSKLTSLFDYKEIKTTKKVDIEDSSKKIAFKDIKDILERILEDLRTQIKNEELKNDLENIETYLNSKKFSIGITGVMSAGKSTMLNALMGKEILGSAVVPETANLTIVKHSKTPSAKVYFWNKQEWNKIENSANSLESMKEFVEETKRVFGSEINNYIKDESKFADVDINNLKSYTSAEHSGKKCNLVKYVELGSDLKFLQDGIEIVDTPGLDDPVIQREEITKEYISKCDIMLHLMNVSQSATLKDVEFIIDAVLYQNITKLLVVITRADTVSKKNLEEVINYTKTSIQRQLKAQNKDSQIDHILSSIKFVAISGHMALLHRTNRADEAINAGYTLEDTGITQIEDYLYDSLFGENSQKGDLLIQSARVQILKLLEKQINILNYEIKLLGKSKDELEKDLNILRDKKAKQERSLFRIKEDISFYKNDAKNYIDSLDTFLQSELIDLQNIIKQRVLNDVKYSLVKDKKRSDEQRVRVIIQTAIKDGIIDIIRDYRYKFIKKSQTIGEQCEQKYHDFGFSIGHKNDNFDARGFFQEDFKSGFLTTSYDVLINLILKETNSAKESKLNELERELQNIIKLQFSPIVEDLQVKAKTLSKKLVEEFFKVLNAPVIAYEQKVKSDEEMLEKELYNFKENDENRAEKSIEIHNKIKKLQDTLTYIKGLNQ